MSCWLGAAGQQHLLGSRGKQQLLLPSPTPQTSKCTYTLTPLTSRRMHTIAYMHFCKLFPSSVSQSPSVSHERVCKSQKFSHCRKLKTLKGADIDECFQLCINTYSQIFLLGKLNPECFSHKPSIHNFGV